MKTKTLSITLVIMMLLSMSVLSGCSKQATTSSKDTSSSTKTEQKTIAIIEKNLVDPFFVSMKEGAEAAAKKNNVNLIVLAPLKANNNQEQIQEVEQCISKKVDAIVLVPADSSGIVTAAKELNEAGIPIINVNTKILDTAGIKTECFVKADDYTAAKKTTEKLAELMNKEGEVIILEGVTASQTSIDLTKGAVETFGKYPNIKIAAQQSANFDRATAMTVTQNLLQAHPNVKAIFADNDEMALGAVEAVAQAGKEGKIIIAGINGSSGAIEAIKAGKMALTCSKDPYNQGYTGVESAVKFLNGETLDKQILIPIKVISKDNAE